MGTSLFLHGWQGSEPEHWQRWVAAELGAGGHDVHFPDFTAPDTPDLDVWLRSCATSSHASSRARRRCSHSLTWCERSGGF